MLLLPPVVRVARSKKKSPLSVSPATVSVALNAEARTYGPAGRSRVFVWTTPSASTNPNVSWTGMRRLLICKRRSAPMVNPPRWLRSAGVSAIVPPNSPAMPCRVTSSEPSPLVRRTPSSLLGSVSPWASPRKSSTSVKPTRTTLVPPVVVSCSKAKTPLRVWPSTVSVTGFPVKPACTRRKGPTGRLRVTDPTEPIANVRETGAEVLLNASVTVPVNWKSLLSSAPSVMPAVRLAAMPWFVMSTAPCGIATVTRVRVPSPRLRLASLTASPTTLAAVSFSNVKLPVSCWPRMPMVTPVPLTFRPGVSISVPSVWVVVVVLIWTSNVPLTDTFGTLTVTTAESRPNTPPPVPPTICRSPWPLVTVTKSRWSVPMRRATLAAAMRVMVWVPTVTRSTMKSPLRRCPRICRVSPVSSTRTNGPAGSDSVCTTPPILNCSLTATPRLLMATRTWSTLAALPVLMRSVAEAVISPANPAAVIRKRALPLVMRTPMSSFGLVGVPLSSPRNSATLLAATRITWTSSVVLRTWSAPALLACSKTKTPCSVCPNTLRLTGSDGVPTSTRTYGPAGSASGLASPANVSLTAAVVLLICSRMARLPSVTLLVGIPRSVTVAATSPASPALVTRNFASWPVVCCTSRPTSSDTAGVPRSSPRNRARLLPPSRTARTSSAVPEIPSGPGLRVCSKKTLPLSRCPRIVRATPVPLTRT